MLARSLPSTAPLLAAALVAVLAPPPSASLEAQEARSLDEGTYRVSVAGRAVGSEIFAVRREGRDVRAVGRVRLDTATAALSSMEAWLQTDADFRPTLFRLRPQAAGPDSYTAALEEDRVRLRTTTAEGERYREFLAPEGLAMFDPRLAHHWYLVLRPRAETLSDGPVRVPAILPVRGERTQMEIRRAGREEIPLGERTTEATRYEVTGDLTATVWTDGDGRVLRLSLPALALSSSRVREGEGGS